MHMFPKLEICLLPDALILFRYFTVVLHCSAYGLFGISLTSSSETVFILSVPVYSAITIIGVEHHLI